MSEPKPLTPRAATRSLANRLARPVDRIRQMAVRLGARSRRVFLVWVRWGGNERGDGTPYEVDRFELLPTPKVVGLDSVGFQAGGAGYLATGSVRLEEVSATLTESQLTGLYSVKAGVFEEVNASSPTVQLLPCGPHPADRVPQPVSFFYEIVEDGRHEGLPLRQKYRLAAQPALDETSVQWRLVLERISEDPARDGSSAYGLGDEG
jgi:hypothetical protein